MMFYSNKTGKAIFLILRVNRNMVEGPTRGCGMWNHGKNENYFFHDFHILIDAFQQHSAETAVIYSQCKMFRF